VTLVDLSYPFDPGLFPNQPGKPVNLEIRPINTLECSGVNTLEITLGNHIGTHIDAPLHLIDGGDSIDRLPLETFYGPAVVVDVPKGLNEAIEPGDLESAEPSVGAGDIALICTGWGGRVTEAAYASHHPYLTEAAAAWLVARDVRMVGIDVQSVDLPHSLRPQGFRYTSLRVLLTHGIPVVHSLTRLEEIRGRRVTLICMPIIFRGADGVPVRAVAHVD